MTLAKVSDTGIWYISLLDKRGLMGPIVFFYGLVGLNWAGLGLAYSVLHVANGLQAFLTLLPFRKSSAINWFGFRENQSTNPDDEYFFSVFTNFLVFFFFQNMIYICFQPILLVMVNTWLFLCLMRYICWFGSIWQHCPRPLGLLTFINKWNETRQLSLLFL